VIRDPAGLLNRIQELEPLCAEPGIRRAVERGDPFKVYRAIWWARRTGKLTAHRRSLDLLLSNRRAFAKPLKGKLWLGTLNGFGATLLSSAEAEGDGTRIATHYVVAIFAVPLFPLGAYVVAGGQRSGLSSSWNIFARVPLSAMNWLWSRGVALAVATAVVFAGVGSVWAARHHDVHVVNALAVPLSVSIGEARAQVPPRGRAVVSAGVGQLEARALTPRGDEVDAIELRVDAGSALLVWNVAGASPVYEETVVYTEKPNPSAKPPPPVLHCGDRLLVLRGVDDVFKEPPRKVSMPQGSSNVTRRRVDLARDPSTEGAQLCQFVLGDKGRDLDALHVAEALAIASGYEPAQADAAIWMAVAVGPQDGERVARAARAARPDDVRIARGYQFALEAAGKKAELVEEFRRKAVSSPDDPKAQYLHLRLLAGPEEASLAEAALVRFPKDTDLLRVCTAVRAEAGDFGGAEQCYRTLKDLAPAEAGHVIFEAASALATRVGPVEAQTEIAKLFPKLDEAGRAEAAALYARAAALSGDKDGDALIKLLEKQNKGEPLTVLRARAGLPVEVKEVPVLADLYRAAATDPGGALARVAKVPPLLAGQLDPGAWGLLFSEAARTGAPAERVLAPYAPVRRSFLPDLRRYVRGEPGVMVPGLSLELRAAAAFVRSRNPGIDPAERKQLLAAARADDPLATHVTQAIQRWPAAAR